MMHEFLVGGAYLCYNRNGLVGTYTVESRTKTHIQFKEIKRMFKIKKTEYTECVRMHKWFNVSIMLACNKAN